MKNSELMLLTKKIVTIRSDVGKEFNELNLINFISSYLKVIPNLVVKKYYVAKDRFNIIATKGNPKIFLLGHMDTVPVTNIEQQKDKVLNNRIYGRGAVDMKGGLALMLMLAKNIDNIGLIFTVDEEYQFLGMKKLISIFKYKPELIINLEPTDLEIVNGCRGITEFELELVGKAVHSSIKNKGVNAIEKTIQLVNEIERELKVKDTFGKTTLNLAYITGGSYVQEKIQSIGNIVPNIAKSLIEIRFGYENPNWKEINELIEVKAKKIGIKVNKLVINFLLGSMYSKGKYFDMFEKVLKKEGKKIIYKNINNTGYYEAQMLQKLCNCECIIFGPGPSSKSHNIDEYLSISQLEKTYKIILSFLKDRSIN